MSTLIKTKGIVIHEMQIKDHDKRIIIFSKEYGKMVVFANGAKRMKSPLLGGTQPFVFGEFQLYEGRNSYTLKQVDILESFYQIRENIDTLYTGLYFLEVIGSVIQEMDPSPELLRLLYVSLMALKTRAVKTSIVKMVFEFRSVAMLGFAPDLSACIQCGNEKDGYILSSKGGILCDVCSRHTQNLISSDGVVVLQYIQNTSLSKLYHFELSQDLFEMLEKPVYSYFRHFLPDKYKSLEFIDMIKLD